MVVSREACDSRAACAAIQLDYAGSAFSLVGSGRAVSDGLCVGLALAAFGLVGPLEELVLVPVQQLLQHVVAVRQATGSCVG